MRALATESEVVLRDGSTVHVRDARAEDRDALERFLRALSMESRQLRFFTAGPDFRMAADRAAGAHERGAASVVATTGSPAEIVAHACFEPLGDGQAEIAFEVADALQGRGISTILMAQLASRARARGIAEFVAEVLPENRRMLATFRDSGFPTEVRREADDLRISLPTDLTVETLERYEERERGAAGAAIRHFLEPASVAVVGASRNPDSVGGRTLRNLLSSGFEGEVYAVNRRAREVQRLRAYRTVDELPKAPELVVVATPAADVVGVAQTCAMKGVPALLVLSAGFAEAGGDGMRRQEALTATCRAAGIRLVGPNCLGVIGAKARVNATFAPDAPPPGQVGLLSQSGGVALALIEQATALGLGLSSFVSIGNRPDVSANDVLEYWEDDSSTDVVLLYLESFGNPRNFARIARRLSRRKPIIAVHAGRSSAGARAAGSHTGAVISGSGQGVDALLEHAGVVRAETLGELFDAAALATAQPLPAGPRVGIVTNAGGPAILCADAAEAGGLRIPELSKKLRSRLAQALPAHAGTANPVDMLAAAGPSEFEEVVGTLAASDEVDALIAIFVPALAADADEVDEAVSAAAREATVPTLLVTFGGRHPGRDPSRPPVFTYPEDAARALARLAKHVEWRNRPRGVVPELLGVRHAHAAGLLTGVVANGGRWLRDEEVAELLDCWGVPRVEQRSARGPAAAGRAAEALGGRVVLKAFGEGIVHRTEVGAVELGLAGEDDVARAARRMSRRLRAAGLHPDGFVVQRELAAGVEMLAGITVDPLLGPLVACGAGGTSVEVLGDVAIGLAPLTDVEARRMVRSLATFRLLDGYRGAPPADVAALEDILLRLGAAAAAHPEVAELDCNPVVVGPHGATVVDARIRVDAPRREPPWPALGAAPPSVVSTDRSGGGSRMPSERPRS
ncbi:MAG TPA: GNAT family N-acetyltransferase [Thermoleophilaceae bacterium]|nr:GNAT family N-acetyltransferase [Thermoleophilaceae bacterium]